MTEVWLAVEKFNTFPSRMIHGANHGLESYWEIAEVLAFLEIQEDRRRDSVR